MKIRTIYLYNNDYYCEEVGRIDKLRVELDRYSKIDSIEIEFVAHKVMSKKEAISKITSNYFKNNSPDIVVINSSISNPLLGMLLLENIKKYIILYDKNDASIHNEELRQKWVLAAEKYPDKILLTEIGFAKLALESTINNLLDSYSSQEVFFTPSSSRESLEDAIPTKPIQKIIYLYNKHYEDIAEDIAEINNIVNIASYQISTTEHAISIINENRGLSNIVLIANTSIAKDIEKVLPSNIEKFIVIPDVTTTDNDTKEWQKLVDAQLGHYEKTKISCIPIEALYLYLYLLLEESLGSYNQNNKLHCSDNIDTKKDLSYDDKVGLLSDLDGDIEDSYLQ